MVSIIIIPSEDKFEETGRMIYSNNNKSISELISIEDNTGEAIIDFIKRLNITGFLNFILYKEKKVHGMENIKVEDLIKKLPKNFSL
jgi:hypothetical protein